MDGSITHLSDYLAILRRRRWQIIKVGILIFTAFAVLGVLLPPVYRSTASLIIEQQDVPADIVQSTVTGYVNQRIKVIETRVLKPERLVAIAEKLGMYEQERAASAQEVVASKMRSHVEVTTVSANVTDPRSGRSGVTTIAFDVSFLAPTPELAQRGAEELAALFINENRAVRTEKAQLASGFLSEEEKRLGQYVAELEAKLAAYKEENKGRLPELMNLNMQLFERTQDELGQLDQQIVALEERKLQLESQLALIEPHTGTSPGGRLREAQTAYLSAAAIYAPDHPDVVRLKREVETLKKQLGIDDSRNALEAQYNQARRELAAAREKYAEDHPDVAALQRKVERLGKQMRQAPRAPRGFELKPDNPAYVAVQTQLDTVKLNLAAALDQRARTKEKLAEYEARMVQTPRVEQEGLALQREYENALKKYREIKQNLMSAEIAVSLERNEKGEQFSLLEPPERPGAAEQPNTKALLLLGLVLGIGGGIGYASVAEYMDRTVRGARLAGSLLEVPVLAAIPYIPNGGDPKLGRG